MSLLSEETSTPEELTCPRCGISRTQRFYGPCDRCLEDLRIKYAGEAREIESEDYVPKMNVTPNAVALKDD
jgi:hypothetical protein